jgi:hypothetical protein
VEALHGLRLSASLGRSRGLAPDLNSFSGLGCRVGKRQERIDHRLAMAIWAARLEARRQRNALMMAEIHAASLRHPAGKGRNAAAAKQETPELADSEASTDHNSVEWSSGGCSSHIARP